MWWLPTEKLMGISGGFHPHPLPGNLQEIRSWWGVLKEWWRFIIPLIRHSFLGGWLTFGGGTLRFPRLQGWKGHDLNHLGNHPKHHEEHGSVVVKGSFHVAHGGELFCCSLFKWHCPFQWDQPVFYDLEFTSSLQGVPVPAINGLLTPLSRVITPVTRLFSQGVPCHSTYNWIRGPTL